MPVNESFGAGEPDKPTNLQADDVSPTKITITWDAPEDTGDSPISSYFIEYYRVGQGSCCATLDEVDDTITTYDHEPLTTGETYVYQIRAKNSSGKLSDPSVQAQATPTSSSTPPEDIVPNSPTNLEADDVSPTEIKLTWDEPAANNGWAITGYKIEYAEGSGSFQDLVADTGNISKTYSHSGLTTGNTYKYKVSAINTIGVSDASNEATATVTNSSQPPIENIVPNRPESFNILVTGLDELTLTWESPEPNSSPALTGFRIESKEGPDGNYTDISQPGPSTFSYIHDDLEEGTQYTYRIYAINSEGESTYATKSGTPEAIDTPTLFAEDVSPTSIELTWTHPTELFAGASIRDYTIEQVLNGGATVVVAETPTPEPPFLVTGLNTDQTYTYVITANFAPYGGSPSSNQASATPTDESTSSSGPTINPPGPPSNVVLTPGYDSISISWNAPSNDGGAPVTGYLIQVKEGNNSYTTLEADTGSTSTSYTHADLQPSTTYTYKIAARNSVGQGGLSNPELATTADEPVKTKPDAPTGLTASSTSSDKINLVWLSPENFGHDAITGYKIEMKQGLLGYTILVNDTASPLTSYTHTGVEENVDYKYRVSAINSIGVSNTSNEASYKIEVEVPEPEPEPEPIPEPEPEVTFPLDFVDPEKDPQYYIDRYNNEPKYQAWFDSNYPEFTIEQAVSSSEPEPEPEPIPVPEPAVTFPLDFVDPEKDPQYYIDRYNNEPKYKAWFDKNYPEFTIEQAVSTSPEPEAEAKPVLDFVDPEKDPQSYIERYNNEPKYKAWFDKTYPDYTIYEAVGVSETQEDDCGRGTHLENGVCVLDEEPGGGGCLIATAAYGSELAHQVQFLREVRDGTLLSTTSGATFMTGFNTFYYSFSPTIADWERQNPAFQQAVKALITPMITTLSIMTLADEGSEASILGLGISVIALNLGLYIAAPAAIIYKLNKKFSKN